MKNSPAFASHRACHRGGIRSGRALSVAPTAFGRVSRRRWKPLSTGPSYLGAVHLNLFTGAGFTVDDVLIDDDPAAGIEPFAHVESMQARIRWTSLFSGKARVLQPASRHAQRERGENAVGALEYSTAARSSRRRPAHRIARSCPTFRFAAAASTSSLATPSPSSTSATPMWMSIPTKVAKW